MEIEKVIRDNFEQIKREKGIRIQEIADARGVTRQTIYSYFRAGINVRTLCKIADLAGVEPWELLKPRDNSNTQDNTATRCPKCGARLRIVEEGDGEEIAPM